MATKKESLEIYYNVKQHECELILGDERLGYIANMQNVCSPKLHFLFGSKANDSLMKGGLFLRKLLQCSQEDQG